MGEEEGRKGRRREEGEEGGGERRGRRRERRGKREGWRGGKETQGVRIDREGRHVDGCCPADILATQSRFRVEAINLRFYHSPGDFKGQPASFDLIPPSASRHEVTC